MPEISDTELANLQRAAGLLDKLWNSPKNGLTIKRMVKDEIPDAKIADLDIIETVTKPYDAKIEEMQKGQKELGDKLDNYLKSQTEKAEEAALRSEIEATQAKYGFNDETMQKVIERMKAKNNPDVEAAAAWVKDSLPKPKVVVPTGISSTNYPIYGAGIKSDDPDIQRLHHDPVKWMEDEVALIMNEEAA